MSMTKVVINKCFGGFGLSAEATEALAKRKGITINWFDCQIGGKSPKWVPITYEVAKKGLHLDAKTLVHPVAIVGDDPQADGAYLSERDIKRDDLDLVAVVEQLGGDANGRYAQLKVVEIPDGIEYTIEEYDGKEWIAEKHRTWA